MSHWVGVDVGGTFTDLVVADRETGQITIEKVSSVPSAPADGVLDAIRKSGVEGSSISRFVHGTTVSTNTAIERSGATVGLITTAGFEDVIEIQRIDRAHHYDLQWDKPRPFAGRRHRMGVKERLAADGSVVQELSEQDVVDAVARMREAGVESIAICYLFAFLNPEHERRTREIVHREWPEVPVSISSDVMMQIREYERTSTVVLDAYVKPRLTAYLKKLEAALANYGVGAELNVMSSAGGALTVQDCSDSSVRTLMSGPAGGVIAARHFAAKAGVKDLITLDMGGTSADVALVKDGEPSLTTDYEIEWGLPVGVPMIDIRTLGAGGGSIARLDEGGRLKVGPESAGADPGPVCYGKGNDEPTVTDANLVLGYLNPSHLLGGDLDIDMELAENAVRTKVAEPLGMDLMEAASGIVDLANANMADLIRIVSVEQGHDPREFALVAFGGGGPLHASSLARALNIGQVIVPPAPGVLSALGLLHADPRYDFVQSLLSPFEELDAGSLREILTPLEERGEELLRRSGADGEMQVTRALDMRYRRQHYDVRVSIPDAALDGDMSSLEEAFTKEYKRLFGYSLSGEELEVVAVHVAVSTDAGVPELAPPAGGSLEEAKIGSRFAYFSSLGDKVECDVFDRAKLSPGSVLPAPCIVEQLDSTIVIGPDDRAQVDESGNIVVVLEKLSEGPHRHGRRSGTSAAESTEEAGESASLSDFFEGYPKCTGCGKMLGRVAFEAPSEPAGTYCDEDCWNFFKTYTFKGEKRQVQGSPS